MIQMSKFVLLLSLMALASAWWDKGHMLVAQVAYNRLSETKQYFSRDQFKELLQAFNSLTDGRSNTWAQAAVWPDDIKGYGADMFDNYHFTNIPYDPDYTFKGMNELQIDINSYKIVNFCKTVLKANREGTTFERAFMARYLMHVIGDIHQPLHNSNFFNETYPNGDLGGNLINVTTANGSVMKLHNFFDSIALYQNPNQPITRPLNNTETDTLEEEARSIASEYPYEQLRGPAEELNSHSWVVETFEIARDQIYKHLARTNRLDQKYQDSARKLLFRQIALAGYRLANTIADIYS